MIQIKAEDIELYPMNDDIYGRRTHQQYVDVMATMIVDIVINYRLNWDDLRKLVDYAQQNVSRLNGWESDE